MKTLVLSQRKLRVRNGVNSVKPKFNQMNMAIPSQAGNWNDDLSTRRRFPEGVETRGVRIQNDNPLLERPGALWVQDIVRALRKQGGTQSMPVVKEVLAIGSRRSIVGLPSV